MPTLRTVRPTVTVFLCLLALEACGRDQVSNGITRSPTQDAALIPQQPPATFVQGRWMPVGTRVGVGVPVVLPPEPYDPIHHGPALPGLAPNAPRFEPRDALGNPLPVHPPNDGAVGFYLTQTTKPWYGAYALQDIGTSISLPSGAPANADVYAPTMLAPGGACIEATMAHVRSSGAMLHQLWAWDWCHGTYGSGAGAGASWDLTSGAFQAAYVRTYQGKPSIAVSVVTPNTGNTNGQCWFMDLYNYTVGGWQQLHSSCGYTLTIGGLLGWNYWESHGVLSSTSCPALASVIASDISLADPNTSSWTAFTNFPADYSLQNVNFDYCFGGGGGFTFRFPVPGMSANTWRAETPNP